MIGAIIGDIVGSVYEFDRIKTKDFTLFGDYHGEKCGFTDDSVMTLAVAKAILEARGDLTRLTETADEWIHELGHRYPACDWGERFRTWLFCDDPVPYNSFGNGAAMRVSPAAWAAGSQEEALAISDRVTELTHNHPEGMKGARATTACIYLARNGASKEEIRDHVRRYYYPLDQTLDEIRPDYYFNETCQETVPQAIQAFLEAADFEDAIRNAVSLGGDSDTLAAVTGGIAEAFFGVPEDLRRRTEAYLPPDLKEILTAFEKRYGKR